MEKEEEEEEEEGALPVDKKTSAGRFFTLQGIRGGG